MMTRKNGDKDDDAERSRSESTKRLLKVCGQETSIHLEDALWNELRAMADERNVSLSELVNGIDIARKRSDLSSAIRRFVSKQRRKRR